MCLICFIQSSCDPVLEQVFSNIRSCCVDSVEFINRLMTVAAAHIGLSANSPTVNKQVNSYLRKPSSLTAAEDAAGPASEKTSTSRLPALGGAVLTGAVERMPSRSADGDGVDWKTQRLLADPVWHR